ncbi:serine aminopeptidase domain-containing protein [Thalassococcus sp. S3]|uniref:alpha/beta hydrolase family protein n=1 Tax=Thalassococcus sp. S3 TaxID=2017482 RepID=UPI0010244F4E|nr:alpha/beta hydrolase [Thalassococcus sp. S3]QBF33494.1 hypothetical protein CFI11_20100 [Thalassococcus sp. S3]
MLDAPSDDMVLLRPVHFPAGPVHLSGTLFLPPDRPRAALVLNGATGVPHGYYRAFARWLAATQGIACLTYDYRDMGASATGPVHASTVRMSDWALVDQPAARAEMQRQVPGVPLWVLGHSLGAMLLPLQEGIEQIERVIGVASGLVHHTDHPWPYQALARLFWFGHGPLAVRLFGHLPARWFGMGEDLPAPVYWQWRRWCTTHGSYLPETGTDLPPADWTRSGAKVKLVAFSDDEMIPPQCVQRLGQQAYGGHNVTDTVISPDQAELSRIGHIGAFARRNHALWPLLIA